MRSILAMILVLGITPLSAFADTIVGCVHQKSGKLRIVGVPGQCKANEAQISWNSEGPQGPQGEQGLPGQCGSATQLYEPVGFTSATFDGDEGLFNFHQHCDDEFPGSRMCLEQEVANSTGGAFVGLADWAWVRPPNGYQYADCYSWQTSGGSPNGRAVNEAGGFNNRGCSSHLPVACCAPATD